MPVCVLYIYIYSSRGMASHVKQKYSPLDWTECFDTREIITIPGTLDISFLFFLGLQINPCQKIEATVDTPGPVFLLHHGAGSSALSFGFTAKHIKEFTHGKCSIVAYDCRGHGNTKTEEDTDFSQARLSDDLVLVAETLYQGNVPDIILVGHSMGGPIVVDVTQRKRLPHILGVSVLDVVEGSAIEALVSMNSYLATRPTFFTSVEQAIQWSVKSHTVRNVESARLSIPPLLKPQEDHPSQYVWRTDLRNTELYWTDWFTGLSTKFLACAAAKQLILAGTDRLDKTLIIGQMQGKFQLHIFPEAGHFLQEDAPSKTAHCLVEFWERNQRLVLPPKVKI
ncbi:hypothetical protein PHYBLDRAFT_177127 [Phycomyces blakesleeanus NRRL 1555(-)]|uniref:Protein phosphatase methylesterase 1 n=1 Tax=Phycomyces blakesleeanus (strain ATCC 8743b / DSM 1359 / FGSC 10004 / NBRC 33097 / NRRL 1555) TaxID=763407 RepID=A0A167P3R6_PHYB8|nr:hypothetical protein PHYBLDRAFT_177127 [Phycomyces blakesleeanus NRRL 1555(-)]OAD77189.1 hypothetical protein PHYBLDRAFT_177127 [Phycomyces blakesleeanus NRRL 1555(-)]|eukprot:XP_018295229.1 hypothetical protein PHYBLDRAFT_177127 [Phycomyces blakesleeanus NRRL 1555(-)]